MCKVFGGMQHHRIAQVSRLVHKYADKNVAFGVADASSKLKSTFTTPSPVCVLSSFDASQPS